MTSTTDIASIEQSSILSVQIDTCTGCFTNIDDIRDREYPFLQGTTYLDHAGTTLYAKSLIEAYTKDLTTNLFGNPHSASFSSQLSSRRIDDTRLQVLRFFNASPDDFDVIFVANATSGIKLVADAFRDHESGFWFGYHADSHTSLVGIRELATEGSHCFRDDEEVEKWINSHGASNKLRLFAYPGQSNMTGHRTPSSWCRSLRDQHIYTLYDAAGLLSTSQLDLSEPSLAPDFTVLSFYKIFGFPDLGALIVRKNSASVLMQRKYFGGGTVEMVTMLGEQWHAKRSSSLHIQLEDGTLPFHNILALQHALSVHYRLYGSMSNISRHCHFLASRLNESLASLRHSNNSVVCKLYNRPFLSSTTSGPVVTFNLLDRYGNYVPKSEVEKLALIKNIQLRTGGLCNPGGIARHLDLSSDEMRNNFNIGHRCGDENDILNGKPTGAIRVSLGAMSSMKDVERLLEFVEEFYVDRTRTTLPEPTNLTATVSTSLHQHQFIIESLSIYPIKSCGAFKISSDMAWEVGEKGLAWDREWCLVHQGTGAALSQKKYPRMTLLRPVIDLRHRILSIEHEIEGTRQHKLEIELEALTASQGHDSLDLCSNFINRSSNVCGSSVDVQIYMSVSISSFFSEALGVPCTLARFPQVSTRHAPARVSAISSSNNLGRSLTLANESPILLISRSSVNRLNECIKLNSKSGGVGKAVSADTFRGNIVIAEELSGGQVESPYLEEEWEQISIGNESNQIAFEVLGPCQRCQMVCVDQKSAQRRQEPFSTLAKTRKREGRVWFGMHLSLVNDRAEKRYVKIGDRVIGR